MRLTSSLILITIALSLPCLASELGITTDDVTRDAYAQPMPAMPDIDRAKFFQGRSLVRQSWVIPPSENRSIAGLGPLYNRISCIACHTGNGRGFAPNSILEPMRSMLLRLSIPGINAHGGPLPHPAYGDQLNEHGAPGVLGEGQAQVTYHEQIVKLNGGEQVSLRSPKFTFVELAYGSLPLNIMVSPRIASPLYGLGLLESVPESTILALAAQTKPDGIKGRVNRVWDVTQGKTVVGRFGWKANMPNLRQQITGAFVGDMGITSSLFQQENCTPIQTECRQSLSAGNPELSNEQLDQIEFYHLALAPPQSRKLTQEASLQRGAIMFKQAQCSSCHIPVLHTGEFPRFPAISNRTIAPYTDLLLHDMGDQLTDSRPDFLATGSEWRTPPLWGIGLAKKIEPNAGFLHDGRARTLLEAIIWHGGEATVSANTVKSMTSADRQSLLRFLESL
ncbi:MAG: di-heme oxidoredictase family protein [Methylophilaceae bacterium]